MTELAPYQKFLMLLFLVGASWVCLSLMVLGIKEIVDLITGS